MKAFEAVPVAANPTYGLMKKGLGIGVSGEWLVFRWAGWLEAIAKTQCGLDEGGVKTMSPYGLRLVELRRDRRVVVPPRSFARRG